MTQTGTKPSIPEDSPELSAQEEQLLAELDDWGRELVETARKRNPSISIAEVNRGAEGYRRHKIGTWARRCRDNVRS